MEQQQTNTIANELLARAETDQALRTAYPMTNEWDDSVDEMNTARLKEIVAEHGWPTVKSVGEKAASAAWILVQHADRDPEFQQHCLKLMKQVPEGEVLVWNVALLEDRVRVNTNRPQLYGSQFTLQEGQFGPRIGIEDVEHLDERRATVGLEPFEEYNRGMRRMYEERQASR